MTDQATADDDSGELVVNTPDGEIDPLEFSTKTTFKNAVYEYGAGTAMDDFKLSLLYEKAHGEDGTATEVLAEVME